MRQSATEQRDAEAARPSTGTAPAHPPGANGAPPPAATRADCGGGKVAGRGGPRRSATPCPPPALLPRIDLDDLGLRLIRLAAAVLARDGAITMLDERWMMRHLVLRHDPEARPSTAARPRTPPPLL